MATAMVWQSKAIFTVIFLGLLVLAHADGGHSCAASPGSCPAEVEPDRNIMMQTRVGIAMAEEKEGEGTNEAEGRYEEGEKKAAVAMGEAVKEELGNLPMACEMFFENTTGCDKPGDITTGVVRDSFKKCCVVGGHPESLCDSLSGEAFNEDDPKASVTNDHCNEMVRLRQAHDDWAHHKDAAQKIATIQLLEHADSDVSHTAASLDDSLRTKQACSGGTFFPHIKQRRDNDGVPLTWQDGFLAVVYHCLPFNWGCNKKLWACSCQKNRASYAYGSGGLCKEHVGYAVNICCERSD